MSMWSMEMWIFYTIEVGIDADTILKRIKEVYHHYKAERIQIH